MANLATTCGPIVKDDELWCYYRGGNIDGPKRTWICGTGLATLRRDGALRVAVVDEDTAEEFEGFGRDESVPVKDDRTRAAVQWKQRDSLVGFKRRYVRLAFHLWSAKLYAFWIE